MIILPVTTPAAAIDQNSVNQAQQNQLQSSEDSRKATDTVKISAEAQQLADNSVNSNAPKEANDPTRIMAQEAAKALTEAPKSDDVQKNPVTQKPEGSKIDIVA
jgi:hypothetical protein